MTMTRAWHSYLLMFVIAAVLGTLYDYIHVWFGVLTYTSPVIAGTTYWVPIEFGCSGLMGVVALETLRKRMTFPTVTLARTCVDGVLLFVGYLITGLFAGKNALTFGLLAPLALLSVASRPTRFVLVGSLIAGIVGPLGEIFMSRGIGFFHYNVADVVPYWLPVLWIIAGGLFIDIPLLLTGEKR